MRHFFTLLMLALTSSIHAQDSFSGPNEFLLGGQVWKCDTSSVTGDTLFVPEDYGTIQSAIDACANGDIILVAPGEYNENIQANGKEFALASHYLTSCDTLDIYETVINGNGGVGLSIVQLEQHIKVIGFTITNCSSGIYYGGQNQNWRYDLYFSNLRLVGNSSHGINGYLWRTGNYLLNSVVSDNGSHGIRMVNKGALYIGECLVENNQGHGIYNNQCGFLAACTKIRNNNGDGIYSTYWGGGFRQYRCIISGNAGDGIHARNTGAQGVYNCTIVDNGEYGFRGTVAARNSIVHSNGSGVHLVDNGGDPGNQSQSSFEYILSESDLSGVGNIVGDPLLDEGFIPGAGSPAIAGGNPEVYDIGGYEGFNAYLTAPGMSIGAIQALELVYGCTEPETCNYSPEANVDDGSCVLSGCMDTEACNFNPVAECEGEACVYTCCPGPGCCDEGTAWSWESNTCVVVAPSDTDFDGCVGMIDLLDLLSVFGTCAESESEEVEWSCGDPLEYQGYDYETVQIGEQCWFAENCKYLPAVSPSSAGSEIDGDSHAYVFGYEGQDVEVAKALENYESFGVLYNRVAMQTWDVCPVGWHVPTDSNISGQGEFHELIAQFAEAEVATELKSDLSSSPGWNGSNNSGFGALPAGYRRVHSSGGYGFFSSLGDETQYWAVETWSRRLTTINSDLSFMGTSEHWGLSVRCIQDSE